MKFNKLSRLLGGWCVATGLTTTIVRAQTYDFTTIAGGTQGTNDGENLAAQFYKPTGVARDAAGNIYVADQANNLIREIMPDGTNWIVTTIAGGARGSRDGTGTNAEFSGPTALAIDSQTNLYVSDQLNYTIRKLTPGNSTWSVSTIAGQAGIAGTNNGTNAEFHNPVGIAIDPSGNLFVADQYNNAIREVMPNGGNWTVTNIAGGTMGFMDGTNAGAQFFFPYGVAVDASDHVYVADQFNNAIRLITPASGNWVVTTIAGQGVSGYSNAVGTNAEFYSPAGIALDENDNVYVADSVNHVIRELVFTNGNWGVSTLAGTNAGFNLPYDVTLDPYGNIYVADSSDNAIRLGISSLAPPQTGAVEVTITPSQAASDGAEFQLDGGAFQMSGSILTDLTPGNHSLTFSNISGYTTPATQPVSVTAYQTNAITVNYSVAVADEGALQVLITPPNAVDEGAECQVDNGALETNGAVVIGLAVGAHSLTFTAVDGYTTPSPQTIYITNAETTLGTGNYVIGSLPSFTVTTSPVPSGDGTVTGGGTFLEGNTATLTATAGSGFEFLGWVGDVTGASNALTVTVNTNLNVEAYFAPTGSLSLVVLSNGYGAVTPDLSTRVLKQGQRYTLSAKAGAGYVFSNWTGTLTTNRNPLVVQLESSMVLQANFVPNPFPAVKGIYNGIFSATNGVAEETSGMLRSLSVNQKGEYSGTLLINGAGHGIGGTFDLAGLATNKIQRGAAQGGPLFLELTLSWGSTNSPSQVTGVVYGTNNGVPWIATNLYADPATNTLASAEFTMLLPPDSSNNPPQNSPGGYSYALITNYAGTARNPAAATARITGALADGTAFNQTVPVSQDGYVPIYENLYGGKGLLLGWINLNLTNTESIGFTGLTWIHPARNNGLYSSGFTNTYLSDQILLSTWTNPPATANLPTNLALVNTITNTNSYVNFSINIAANGKVTGSNVNGTVNNRTGLVTVAIGIGSSRVNAHGALLLDTTNGGGYYLNGSSADAVILTH